MTTIVSKDYLLEFKNTKELCDLLLKTPHYQAIGPAGIFAIVETAKSLNIDPRLALMGGLYYVKGKVEMSARMMNALIRANKHSIKRDEKSDDTICILHGKRADSGDTWTESFSFEEATKAGLVRGGGPWMTFRRDMLFARALSRLARQLFPDIIGNCYVEGEISLDPNISESVSHSTQTENKDIKEIEKTEKYPETKISLFQIREIEKMLFDLPEDVEKAMLAKCKVSELGDIPHNKLNCCKDYLQKIIDAKKQKETTV